MSLDCLHQWQTVLLRGSISRLQQCLHGARLRIFIIRHGRAGCPSAALQACAPFTPQVAPGCHRGSPCMCCLVLEVTRWGRRAEAHTCGQKSCPGASKLSCPLAGHCWRWKEGHPREVPPTRQIQWDLRE